MNKRGKITILVLVLILISIGIFSLYYVFAQTTNTKTYDAETQTIAIKEGSNEIAKIKLNTPLVHKVIRGKDRLVAEFTIENNVISSNVFNDMEFYDVKNNMNKFNRPFTYKYKNFYGVEVHSTLSFGKTSIKIPIVMFPFGKSAFLLKINQLNFCSICDPISFLIQSYFSILPLPAVLSLQTIS